MTLHEVSFVILFTPDSRIGKRVSTTMVKMNSVVLCTSVMTGEDGMTITVTNHSVSSAKDVSIIAGEVKTDSFK